MADLNLAINIAAVDLASSTLKNIGSAISSLASGNVAGAATAAAQALTGISVAAVGAAAQSVQMAGDFQESMTALITGAGEAQDNLSTVSSGILDLAAQTATSTKQLADGMYMIESAGYHGANGLSVLKAAAQGAKVGSADLGTVAGAVTTILTDYHLGADQATNATNALVATVASGKTHLGDLASSMGSVLPLASSLGIGFNQVGGAIATMTNAGMDAQRASMNLANAIRSLSAPTSAADKAMQSVGLSAQDLKDTLSTQGLTAAIQLVEDHVGKSFPAGSVEAVNAFKAIMGGATGYNVALMLGGQNMATFESNVKNIGGALHSGTDSVAGWSAVQEDFNFKLGRTKEVIETLQIRLGQALLPVVGALLEKITPFIARLGDLLTTGGALAPILNNVGGMLRIMAANWTDLAATSQPLIKAIQSIESLIGSLLPGAISQGLRILNDLNSVLIILAQGLSTLAVPALSLFGQILQNAQKAAEPILNAIQAQLIPAISMLVSVIAPLIASIIQWIVQSNIVPIVFAVLSTVISTLITVISTLITAIANVIQFFRQNQVAADALLAVLTLLATIIGLIAIAIVVALLAALPGMIAGFIAGAAAAWSLAVAVIAATWPFVLIVVAIVAVIAGIILLVQHWSQFSAWFMGLLRGIGAFFASLWAGIVTVVRVAWQLLVTIVTIYVQIWIAILTFPFRAIAALFVWLYEHNRYVQALCDLIVRFFQGAIAWLSGAWQSTVAWLAGVWSWLVGIASSAWSAVTGAIQAAVLAVWSWLVGLWSTISGWLSGKWGQLSGIASSAWQAVSGVFSSAWSTYIAGPISSLWTSMTAKFDELKNMALNWGKNLIGGFIDGIKSAAGKVKDTVSNVANTVKDFLGFHSPAKEGPGSELDVWGPNMVKGFAEGVQAAAPHLRTALDVVMQPLAPLGVTHTSSGVKTAAPSSASSGSVTINITVNAPARSRNEAQEIAKEVLDEISRELRRSGKFVTWTSGGKA